MTPTVLVVSVLDGDTIEVLHSTHRERVRLSGIDCPEKGQAYGQRARHAASGLIYGKDVTLMTHGSQRRLVLVVSEVFARRYDREEFMPMSPAARPLLAAS